MTASVSPCVALCELFAATSENDSRNGFYDESRGINRQILPGVLTVSEMDVQGR